MKTIPKNRSGKRIINKCKGCDQPFEALMIKCRKGEGLFCSFQCYQSYRKKNKKDEKRQNCLSQKKNKYGLSEQQYIALFKKQDNRCAICSSDFLVVQAHVDHCHNTKKVRGLLCSYCNTIIGMAEENIDILQNAINYLNNDIDK